ncbi:LacI family DNA-binding transcriptional regulator [Salipiger profundus]|uniref:LacI family DNA-binding transcriptional regulator n=1 Tax=Salipiger profundus TaxID=1229727 RepID=UPI0008E2C872|nr:LacI family DNA-binding transcriptional regulator [Salipiger profundus]SFD41016.1 transcriptional regulator, LacI family [Salipiger profundus]
MTDKQKRTIYDIAERVSASPSTVSAALNGSWKKRRIKKETAERIIQAARDFGYSANLQARGLRTSNSGLVALLIPDYNRFFSNIAQTFSREVRARGQCPVIVSTDRDPEEEGTTVADLTAYSIDALFVAGAAAPDEISRQCQAARIPHVFVDQPCSLAASVVTDNRNGARILTDEIMASMVPESLAAGEGPYFIGGDRGLPATANRIEGYKAALYARLGAAPEDHILATSYDVGAATLTIADLYAHLGRLPAGLFINSDSVFEGVLRFLATLPEAELQRCAVGCFDYEPFGQLLRFPVHMIRQRHQMLIQRAFALLEAGGPPSVEIVQPELYRAGSR